MNGNLSEAQAEIEVLDILLKQTKVLARTRNPMLRIAAARWEVRISAEMAEREQEVAAGEQEEAA